MLHGSWLCGTVPDVPFQKFTPPVCAKFSLPGGRNFARFRDALPSTNQQIVCESVLQLAFGLDEVVVSFTNKYRTPAQFVTRLTCCNSLTMLSLMQFKLLQGPKAARSDQGASVDLLTTYFLRS
jgi:hypothetical protein